MEKSNPYEYYDNKLGVKVKFLISNRNKSPESLCLMTYRSLKKRMDSSTCCEKQLRRGSLGQDALILFSSLSQEWKDAIAIKFGKPKAEIKKSWFADHYIADREAFDFFVAYRYGDKNNEKLDLKYVEQYTFNASVLNTVLEIKKNRKAYAKALGGVRIDIWDSLSKDVNAFREVDHNLPTTKDGLRRKATKYAKEGYITLVSGKLKNNNAKKVSSKEQEALLDELLAKHTNLDNQLISEIYNTVADQLGWEKITAPTVANRKKKSKLVTYAGRQGASALSNNMLMQNKRKAPSTPMLYWTLDGWDVELLYQETTTDKKGNSVTTYHNRLTVVIVLDPYNKYPVGYAIDTHETPDLIKRALQNAMQYTKQTLGDLYMPYQIQSDRYSIKKLTPIYQAVTKNFTPAQARNGKSKVIEPYFNYINKKYCKLLDNWSGHNVDSGSKSQPNSEYLNKIKKNFPDKAGCIAQIESIIKAERNKKALDYSSNWLNTKEEFKSIMPLENYLLTFGSNTGMTNKLRGDGLRLTIHGQHHFYDSYDIDFRHNSHLDWSVQYDVNDLDTVLAVSADGKKRFLLEQKYIQPMALADRQQGDSDELKKIKDFNKSTHQMIIEQRAENARILEPLMQNPKLEQTLAKHLLTDSLGQHKNHKSKERLAVQQKASKLEVKQAKKEAKTERKNFLKEQEDYYNSKVDINQYLDN